MNSSSSASNAPGARLISAGSNAPEIPWGALDLLTEESYGLKKWRSITVNGRFVRSYVFIGPRAGRIPIRLALLGGIDPSDQLSTGAIVKLLIGLDLASLLAEDFALFVYPAANPPSVACGALDFLDASWQEGSDSIASYFERELTENQFDGIITVKSGEPIDGFQIQVSSRVIATEVLWPGLEMVERSIPLAQDPIQVVPRLQEACKSVLGLTSVRPGPFSLLIRTPQGSAAENQISAIVFSIEHILRTYRKLVRQADSL
jgi:hypothetical protein